MKIGNERQNFFVAHYDWLVAGVGLLSLAGAAGFFVLGSGTDVETAVSEAVRETEQLKSRRSETGVPPLEMSAYNEVSRQMRQPPLLAGVAEREANFLASERRVKCVCGKAIPGDAKVCPKCPFCGVAQEAEKPVVLDADGDGMPDAWERKNGFAVNDAADAQADADGDGFTNFEEFQAKTDPRDRKDHPDYLADLKLRLPLEQTYLPFVFRKANRIPNGWRLEFFNPKLKNVARGDTGTLTAKIGEEIAKTGFVVRGYTPKSEKQKIKGSVNTRTVDCSEAVVERVKDAKSVTLVIQTSGFKPIPVDKKAKLVFARGVEKTYDVSVGSEIELFDQKFKVLAIEPSEKSPRVVLENVVSGKRSEIGS